MRAVGIMVHGGPEALEMLDVPEVHAGPGQIRIRNRASAVNPTDVIVRNGMRAELQKKYPPPYIPGMDLAGTVDEVGEGDYRGKSVTALLLWLYQNLLMEHTESRLSWIRP